MAEYRGTIEDHIAMESEKKKTPGIEFSVTLKEKNIDGKWEPIERMSRRFRMYFSQKPGADHSYSMKKLAFAGYKGEGLAKMNLRGNGCEVWSKMEPDSTGKEHENFELALPASGSKTEKSDDAFLAIDSILQSAPMPEGITAVEAPTRERSAADALDDIERKRAEDAAADASVGPADSGFDGGDDPNVF